MSDPPTHKLVDHLFRHEAGRLTATLVNILGAGQWDVAEEIVQETLMVALSRWTHANTPDNPAAWLTQVARRRALDVLRRRRTARLRAPDVAQAFQLKALELKIEAHFSRELSDDVLCMMFSCCAPSLSPRAQVTLILKTLGGFSVHELAEALFASKASVERQISRAKATVQEHGLCALDDPDIVRARLPTVQCAIYAMFNEGYHGGHARRASREELCAEAIRLAGLLAAHSETACSSSHALMSLLCLNAARIPARRHDDDTLIMLEHQDRSCWSTSFLTLGFSHLKESASGDALTSYHVEAALAAVHASASTWSETDWARVVSLYDALLRIEDTAVIRLNRAIALGERDGPLAGLDALEPCRHDTALSSYPFVPAARARCLAHLNRKKEAAEAWRSAADLARSEDERTFFEQNIGLNSNS
jgi:RNA polymerase sigma factor (sigma-70 family)